MNDIVISKNQQVKLDYQLFSKIAGTHNEIPFSGYVSNISFKNGDLIYTVTLDEPIKSGIRSFTKIKVRRCVCLV